MNLAITFLMVSIILLLCFGDVEQAVWVGFFGPEFQNVVKFAVANRVPVCIVAGAIGIGAFMMRQKH